MSKILKPSPGAVTLLSSVLRLAVAGFILGFPCARAHSQGEERTSIHEMEWNTNKDRVSHDEKAPLGLTRQPMVKKTFEVLRRRVIGFHPHWADALYHTYDFHLLSTVLYFSFDVDTATGRQATVYSWETTNLVNVAHAAGVKVALAATNFGSMRNAAILRSPGKRARLIQSLVQMVTKRGAEGVHIDFEDVAGSDRGNLVIFMNDLSAAFHAALPDPEVSMAIPAVDWHNAYDVASLGKACDYLILMGYDFHYAGSSTAGAIAPLAGEHLNVAKSVHDYLARSLPPDRLVLGVPYYGYAWPTENGDMNSRSTGHAEGYPVAYSAHKTLAHEHGTLWDDATSSPWYRYRSDNQWHQAWFEDSVSLSRKYMFVDSSNLGGISIWALSYDAPNDELWKCIRSSFALDTNNFTYADFRSTAGLTLTGAAAQCEDQICLSSNTTDRAGGLWYVFTQGVRDTFMTSFRFRLIGTPQQSGNAEPEKLTFVIQNCDSTGLGGGGRALGSVDDSTVSGLTSGLALELDVWSDPTLAELPRNQMSVQTRTRGANGGIHRDSLGSTSFIPDLVDGAIHAMRIQYAGGRLSVYVDDQPCPCLGLSLNIAHLLALENGRAWVGFTGSAASTATSIALLSWTFSGTR